MGMFNVLEIIGILCLFGLAATLIWVFILFHKAPKEMEIQWVEEYSRKEIQEFINITDKQRRELAHEWMLSDCRSGVKTPFVDYVLKKKKEDRNA